MTPRAQSFLAPASEAAEAGSQPIPLRPMIALASAISCSVTDSTTPPLVCTSRSAFSHETGAPIRMRRQGFRILDVLDRLARAALEKVEERRCSLRLDNGKLRESIDDTHLFQLSQSLAECRNIAEIATGQDEPIRNLPASLVEHFDRNGFLAFDSEGIDGVEQINPRLFGKPSHKSEDLVEVGLDLDRQRSVFKRLGQLSVSDLAVGQEDDRLQAAGCRVGRHRRRKCCRSRHRPPVSCQGTCLRDAAVIPLSLNEADGL